MTPALTLAFRAISNVYPDAILRPDHVYLPSLAIRVERPPAHRRQPHLQWQAVSVAADVCAESPVRAVEALVVMLRGAA